MAPTYAIVRKDGTEWYGGRDECYERLDEIMHQRDMAQSVEPEEDDAMEW